MVISGCSVCQSYPGEANHVNQREKDIMDHWNELQVLISYYSPISIFVNLASETKGKCFFFGFRKKCNKALSHNSISEIF